MSLTLILAIFLARPLKAEAINLPPPDPGFYVTDEAGVLSTDTKDHIRAVSADLEAQTGAQVVVVTLDSLNGRDLETTALTILRTWGIGEATKNNGVLILLVLEGQSRIEVGYGLEGVLPDGVTGRIQDEFMLPHYREGDFDAGILGGYDEITQRIAQEYDITLNRGVTSPTETLWPFPSLPQSWLLPILIAGLLLLLFLDVRYFNGLFLNLLIHVLLRGGLGFGSSSSRRSGGGGSGGGGGSSRGF